MKYKIGDLVQWNARYALDYLVVGFIISVDKIDEMIHVFWADEGVSKIYSTHLSNTDDTIVKHL